MDVFLKESKTKLSTLTDETKVHVVIGNEACDLDSTVSALVYAFYLYSLSKEKTEDANVVYIPVLNIPRRDNSLRMESIHCLRANQIVDDTIVFRDEIDLTALHKRGQLILTLVDHNVLIKSDAFMDGDIVEIIDHHSNGRHDDNDREIDITLEMVGSCCTLVAEKILKDDTQILDEATTTLLLGTILIDTYNLSKSAQKMTPKDQAMVAELQEMYPHIDRQKLFDDIEKLKFDVSGLSTEDLLRKDYKSLLGETVNIGLSSITLHLKDLLQRPSIENDLQRFCTAKGLHILCLVNVAVIDNEVPQRQLGVYSAGFKALKDSLVRTLLEAEAPSLQLAAIQDSPSVVAAFDQGNVAASRKKIMPIVQQFLEDLERDSAHVNKLLENKPDCNTDLLGGDFMTTLDPLEANRGSPTTNQNNANDDLFGLGSLSSLEQTNNSMPAQNANSDDPFSFGSLTSSDHITNSMPAQNANSDDLLSYGSLTSSHHITNRIPAQNVNSDDLFSYGSLTSPDHITNYVPEQNKNDPFGLGIIVAPTDSTSNNNNAWQNIPESTPFNNDPISGTGLEDFNDTGPGPPVLLDLDPLASFDAHGSTEKMTSPDVDFLPELTSTNSVQRPSSLLDLDPFEVMGDSASSSSTLASPNLFESTPVTFDPMTTSPSTPSSVQMEEMDDLLGLDAFAAQQSPKSTSSDTSPSLNPFQHSSPGDQNDTDMLGLGHIIGTSMHTNTGDNDEIFGVDTSLPSEENINENGNNLGTDSANYQTVTGDDEVGPQESVHNLTENKQQIESHNSVENWEDEMEALSSTGKVTSDDENINENSNNLGTDPANYRTVTGDDEVGPQVSVHNLTENKQQIESHNSVENWEDEMEALSSTGKVTSDDENINENSNNLGTDPANYQTVTGDDEVGPQVSVHNVTENKQQIESHNSVENWEDEMEALSSTGKVTSDDENINENSNNLGTDPANYRTVTSDDEVGPQVSVHNLTENKQQIESHNSVENWEDEMEALSSTGKVTSDDVFESISNSNNIPIMPSKVFPRTPSNSVSDTADVLSSIDERFLDSQILVDKVEELHRSKLRCEANEVADIITINSDSQKSVFRREESLSLLGDEERAPSPSTETFSDDGSNSSSGESYTVTDDNRGLDQFVITQIQEVDEEEELSDPSKNTAVAKNEKEEILVQEQEKTFESQGIINNLQHNTSKENIETELSQENIAMVEGSEETPIKYKDITMTAVESGGPAGKTVEEVCDYEDMMVQVASTTEAEIESGNEEKRSISDTDCVEPLQNEMGEICVGDEQADKGSELQVTDIDADAAVKDKEKDKIQKGNVTMAAIESEEQVNEVHDYVENVVQMALFDYKQDATEPEIGLQYGKDQLDKVGCSTETFQPLQENAILLSTVDEQLDRDLDMHQDVNNSETSFFHNKKEHTSEVAEEVSTEDEKEEILVQEQEKTFESQGIINNLQHNTSKENIETELSQENIAMVEGSEETPIKYKDITMAAVESGGPAGKTVEEVCEYEDMMIQVASTTEAEIKSGNEEKRSISDTDCVEPLQNEMGEICIGDEQADKVGELQVTDIDADAAVKDKEKDKIQKGNVTMAAIESEEQVNEVHDYVETVVQMALFDYKQDATEPEIPVQYGQDQLDKVGSSTETFSPLQENAILLSTVDEQLDKDLSMHQDVNNSETSFFHNKEEHTSEVAGEVSTEDEKEEILVQEQEKTFESQGIINNLQHNTSKENIETELSQENIAMVEGSEETPIKYKDITMTAVESGGPAGKTVEDVCDYEDMMIQVASTTEAEIKSGNEEKRSISDTECVEPLQNEMGEICIGDEQADKVSELQVTDIIDADAALKDKEKDKIQKGNVTMAAIESEEQVNEVHDYVENVVQMALFDYKQDATEPEIGVQYGKDQLDKVGSSTETFQPLQENAILLSTVDEQLDKDLSMHQDVNNSETSFFHNKEEHTSEVAGEVSTEDLSNLMCISQSQSTVEEGSCEATQVEENKAAGGTNKPTDIEFINADVTMPTMLTGEQSNVFRSEQQQEADFGGNEVGEDMSNQTAVNVNNEEKCESVEETVIPAEQSDAKPQTESTSEHQEDVRVTADEVSSYVDSVVRLACYTHKEQMQAIALQDSVDPQELDDMIIEEVNGPEDSAVIDAGISVSQVVDEVNSQVQTASFESPEEDITTETDVPSTDGIIPVEVISPMASAVTEAGVSVVQIDTSAESPKEEDIKNESLTYSTEGEVAEEVTFPKDSVVETAIFPAEMTVIEASIEPTECAVTETAISTSNSPITESVISPTEGSMLETAITDNGVITAADVNPAAIDRTVTLVSTEENIEDEQRDLIQTMDASSDEAVSSFPYESTLIRPETLSLSTSRGGKTKIQPNFATSYNSAGTPVSLLSDDGSIHSVMTLDAVSMFPTTPSPGSLSDSEDDLGDDTTHRKQDSVNLTNLKRLVSVDLAMAEDISGDWTGEKEILEEVAARQQEKQRQLDLRQRSSPTLKEQGRQLSVASAAAKQRMEGVQISEEWQDDEFHQQKLSGHEHIEDDSFYHRSVPGMDNIAEDDRLRLRVDSDFISRLRNDSDLITEAGSLPRSFTSDGKQKLRVDSDLKRLRGDSSMSERSEEGQDSAVSNRTLGKFDSKMRHMSEDSLEDDIDYLQEEGALSTDEEDADLGARPKKRIPAELNLDGVDQMNGRRVSESMNGATPSLLTPTSIEMSWDDDGGTGRHPERIPEYTAKQELEDNKNWRRVVIAGKEHAVDMRAINPYKKVLSHGGYYGDGLNAIIVFASCYMPDKSRKDYNYVMHNLFLYVVSTLELLVAQDYMIVYFHGASPKNRIPSLGWMRKCYKMIDRKLRKNLKGLYLVHPTTWLKTIVRLTRPFVSSKFSSKLKFIYGLEELEKLIPMDFVYVPDEVRRYDDRIKRKENTSNWWGWLGYSNSISDDDFEDNGEASDLSSIDDLDDLLFPQFPQKRSKYHMGNHDFHSPTDEDGRVGVEMSEDSGCSEDEDAHIDGVEGGGFMEDDIFAYSSGTVSPVSRTPRPLFMISRRQSKESSRPLSKDTTAI